MHVATRVSSAILVVGLVLSSHVRLGKAAGAQQSPATTSLLAQAATYLEGYEKTLAAVTAQEDYSYRRPDRLRETKADIMLLDLGDSNWTEFRDVFELNRQPVRDHEARLEALFSGPSGNVMANAQKIADASAQYNVGPTRNINVPTMALTYLSRQFQPRSEFRVVGQATLEGVRTTILAFTEIAKPSMIHVPFGTLETSGRFWIAPGTGAVLKTELSVNLPKGPTVSPFESVRGTITVSYIDDRALNLLVPSQMDEAYSAPEKSSGHATYSKFHSFAVDVQTMRRGGGGGA